LPDHSRAIIDELAEYSLRRMRHHAPLGKRFWTDYRGVHKPGTLKDSIRVIAKTYRSFELVAGIGAPYARVVQAGSRAHTIGPSRISPTGRLRLPPKFPFVVKHPGTRPNPFWARGIRDIGLYIRRRLTYWARMILRGVRA